MSFGSNIEKEAVTTLLRRCRNQTRFKTLKLTSVLAHSTRSAWKAARLKVLGFKEGHSGECLGFSFGLMYSRLGVGEVVIWNGQ